MGLEESSVDTLDHQKDNNWVTKQMKTETLLEAEMKTPKLSYSGHIVRRQGFLFEKTIILEKNRRQQEKRKTKYERD